MWGMGCSASGSSLRSAAPTDREKVKDRKLLTGGRKGFKACVCCLTINFKLSSSSNSSLKKD